MTIPFQFSDSLNFKRVGKTTVFTQLSLVKDLKNRSRKHGHCCATRFDWDKTGMTNRVLKNSSSDASSTRQFAFISIWKGKWEIFALFNLQCSTFEQTDAIKWVTIFGACKLMEDFSIWDRKPFKQYISSTALKGGQECPIIHFDNWYS